MVSRLSQPFVAFEGQQALQYYLWPLSYGKSAISQWQSGSRGQAEKRLAAKWNKAADKWPSFTSFDAQ